MIDLKDKVFGMLTVIERAKDYVAPSGYKLLKWKCRCECGREVDVVGKYLKNGSKKSCGCDFKRNAPSFRTSRKVTEENKPNIKSDEQKFKGILGSVKYRKKCYISEMARALCLRYGVADLKEWVQDSQLLDTLAACDPDVATLLKYLYKNTRLTSDYLTLFKGMDLQDPVTKAYCINLAVRELVMDAIDYGADLEEVEGMDIQENEIENEVA